ncbi:MAG: leucine-rich repeat protein [Rikenellaceae bacterium]
MKYDVFISYRREGGRDAARLIQKSLQFYGYSVFFDYDSLQDGVFNSQIFEAIESTPIFLLLLSKNSMQRCVNDGDWVAQEIRYAIKHNRKIVPVNVDGQFDGFPKQLCTKGDIGDIVGAIQFTKLDMGELFDYSLEHIIEKRIMPLIKPDKNNIPNRKKLGKEQQATVEKPFGKMDYVALGSPRLLTISNDYTSIESDAFKGCDTLIDVTIPDSVTSIGKRAFYKCENLTLINIPNSIKVIEDYAFYYCKNISSISIPDSVVWIGKKVFEYCYDLKLIKVSESSKIYNQLLKEYKTKVNYNEEEERKSEEAKKRKREEAGSDPVLWIGEKMLECYKDLKTITVSETGEIYKQLTGGGKSKVNHYEEDKKRKKEEEQRKQEEEKRKTFTKKDYEDIGSPSDIIISDYVTIIHNQAFHGCNLLVSVKIPNSVRKIGTLGYTFYGIFENCTSLKTITMPDSIKLIGCKAFKGCSSLATITIPGSVTEIGSQAFADCTSLSVVNISNSIIKIAFNTFENCTSLTSVVIPDSVREIGPSAFKGCSSLTSVTIPNSVTAISSEYDPFLNCNQLRTIKISKSSPIYKQVKRKYAGLFSKIKLIDE